MITPITATTNQTRWAGLRSTVIKRGGFMCCSLCVPSHPNMRINQVVDGFALLCHPAQVKDTSTQRRRQYPLYFTVKSDFSGGLDICTVPAMRDLKIMKLSDEF